MGATTNAQMVTEEAGGADGQDGPTDVVGAGSKSPPNERRDAAELQQEPQRQRDAGETPESVINHRRPAVGR